MKIGLMGGSFDPVHLGHIEAARGAIDQHNLDKVILLPAAETPRKRKNTLAPAHHRLSMLRIAAQHEPNFAVSDFEMVQGDISFTINTVRHFRKQHPADELFWIIGADQVPFLDQWRSIEDLAQLVHFIYLVRPSHEIESQPATPGLILHRCEGPYLNISSSELREKVRQQKPVGELIHPEVIVYIGQWGLYQ